MLQIPVEDFLKFDLQKPLRLDRQFDLVVSLEVAEHLPSQCAETFTDSLVSLGEIVLFSAAIPFQGGTHHVNEQWPDYWVKIFQERGYVAIDCIRKRVWQNPNVEWWYAQNILLFVKENCLENYPALKAEFEKTNPSQLSIVHPEHFTGKSRSEEELKRLSSISNRPLREVLSCLLGLTKNALKRRVAKTLPKN
ncbi:MAG: hypothetical protein H0T92_15175 [Pyrinomonadaceae bacterium]|nr:hypothetical protein [Pyrinomonadaceae bacterium]